MLCRIVALALVASVLGAEESHERPSPDSNCGALKMAYKHSKCCGNPHKDSGFQVVPMHGHGLSFGHNPCQDSKPADAFEPGDNFFSNTNCTTPQAFDDSFEDARDVTFNVVEQAGANVTKGYKGDFDVGDRQPITGEYFEHGLCPVNVHWHLGAEHYNKGQYDEHGDGPDMAHHRRMAEGARLGFRCHHYDGHDERFTKEYDWHHCQGMKVGETYEVHWPHSAAGACGTPWQYQSPFYDGVFCRGGIISLSPINTFEKIGVQGQVFTIINDESYYYPDLINGAIVDHDHGYWHDVAKYTGSTTGTSRNNLVCSRFAPITWQVDRTCHLISASSFDKMCADMKTKGDDMSMDLHAHGARELVADHLAANNQQDRRLKQRK